MMELWIRRVNVALRRRIKVITTWMRRRMRRPPHESVVGGLYGTAPQIWSALRCCLLEVAKNPLEDYPSFIALYGMEPDATLLPNGVSATNFVLGNDSNKVFTRGDGDPAISALASIGARRVLAETIEMCTLDADTQFIEAIPPFIRTTFSTCTNFRRDEWFRAL